MHDDRSVEIVSPECCLPGDPAFYGSYFLSASATEIVFQFNILRVYISEKRLTLCMLIRQEIEIELGSNAGGKVELSVCCHVI